VEYGETSCSFSDPTSHNLAPPLSISRQRPGTTPGRPKPPSFCTCAEAGGRELMFQRIQHDAHVLERRLASPSKEIMRSM